MCYSETRESDREFFPSGSFAVWGAEHGYFSGIDGGVRERRAAGYGAAGIAVWSLRGSQALVATDSGLPAWATNCFVPSEMFRISFIATAGMSVKLTSLCRRLNSLLKNSKLERCSQKYRV